MWTSFMDMHSGGGRKEAFSHCYIEAPEDQAFSVFYSRFGHSPQRVTCTCCGADYSTDEYTSLEQATGYERGCEYVYFDADGNEVPAHEWHTAPLEKRIALNKNSRYIERKSPNKWVKEYLPLDAYLAARGNDVLVIRAAEISDEERYGGVPQQGYVWLG